MRRFTDEEKERIWDMHQAGVPVKRIARTMGRQNVSLRKLISGSGGIRPRARVVSERHLALAEREEKGGYWKIAASLTQTGTFATELTDPRDAEKYAPVTMDDLEEHWVDQVTPWGTFTRLAPAVEFSHGA